MTDNRTTELLRELRRTLEKCRRTEDAGFDTYWITAVALDTSLDELEQAIAATLGSVDKGIPQGADGNLDQSQVDWLRLMPDGWDGTPPTLGGGKLTAKQVREAIYKNIGANPYNVEYYTSIIDHKAIADELNALLRSGTCKNIAPSYLDFLCSECGFVHYHSDENDSGDGNDWAFCPRCGKVVEQ